MRKSLSNRFNRVVVVGSVGFDQIMELPGELTDWILPEKLPTLNVSFTVSTLRREFGGTGGNIAYTLGLLGKKPRLVAVLGRDGERYKQHLHTAGVDVSQLVVDPDQLSALGTVMTDSKQRQIWSYFPGPLTQLANYRLQMIVKSDDLVVLTPSEPGAFKKHLREAVLQKLRFMFDPAFFLPNLSIEELKMGIENAEIVIGNEYEIGMMEKRVNQLIRNQLIGKQILVKTMGERGAEFWQDGKHWTIPAVKVKQVADPSGAGDAFRGGFLAGYIDGKPVDECVRMGAVAGAFCVEYHGTQNHAFTVKKFYKRLEESYGKKNI